MCYVSTFKTVFVLCDIHFIYIFLFQTYVLFNTTIVEFQLNIGIILNKFGELLLFILSMTSMCFFYFMFLVLDHYVFLFVVLCFTLSFFSMLPVSLVFCLFFVYCFTVII